jgi:hypothetical protein
MKKRRNFTHSIRHLFRTYLLPALRLAFRSGVTLARDVLLVELQAMLQRLSAPGLTSTVVIEA